MCLISFHDLLHFAINHSIAQLLSNSQPIVAKSQDIIDLTKSEGSVGAVSQPTSQDVIDLSGERAASLDSVSRPSVGSNDVLELMDDGSWHRI